MRQYVTFLFFAFGILATAAMAGAENRPSLFLIFFRPWSAELSANDEKIIREAVSEAKATPQSHVTLLGYADMEGSSKANLDLAKQRVMAVRRALIHDGYPGDEITVKPFGSVKPMGDSQESRRVEITIRAP